MLGFIKEIFQDHTDSFSSKRFITVIAALLVFAAFIADLGWDLSVPQFMYEGMMFIVITGIGITGAEQFAANKKSITGTE